MTNSFPKQLSRLARGAPCVVFAALAVACYEEPPVTGPGSGVAARATSPNLTQSRIRTGEREFAELAEQSPSSAGFYFDALGRLVVVVRDRADDASAAASVLSFVRHISDRRLKTATAVIQPAQYTFQQLSRWRDIVFDSVLGSVRGVTTLDLHEQTNRVKIGISQSLAGSLRASLPHRFVDLGIDTAAVSYDVVDPQDVVLRRPPMVARVLADSVTYQFQWDTLVGGIYVQGENGGCTLGVVTDQGSTRGLVTASHCSDETFGNDGGPITQAQSRTVGYETSDPDGWGCGFFQECRFTDASFYTLSSGVPSEKGLIVRTMFSAGPGSGDGSRAADTNRPYFIVDAVDAYQGYVGQYVHKVGATTGWTWGQITGTCEDKSDGFWNIAVCIYESNLYVWDGDSGSPVFTPYGDGYAQDVDLVTLVGIVKAKVNGPPFRSWFSKWAYVSVDLGTTDAIRGSTLSTPSISGSILFTSPTVSWTAVSGATRYNIFKVTGSQTLSLGSTTSTSFADGNANVLEYTGATEPNWAGKIQYHVYAVNGKEKSAKSNVIWYRGASGTFSVNINGPSVVGPNNYNCSVWTAQVTGASTIVSYAWSGEFTSTDSYVAGTIPQGGATLQLAVVDDQGRQGMRILNITYNQSNTDQCI